MPKQSSNTPRQTRSKQILTSDWGPFLDGFSRDYERCLVTVELRGHDLGSRIEARELPLNGITLETKDPCVDNIIVDVGSDGNTHFAHTIFSPMQIWAKRTPEGNLETIEIDSEDGTTTVLYCVTQPKADDQKRKR